MDGLIIKKKWLDLILSGKKTLEIRGCSTKKTGVPIYLLESGSRRVRGTCIIQSVYPISCSDWSEERGNHCVDLSYKELKYFINFIKNDIRTLMHGYWRM